MSVPALHDRRVLITGGAGLLGREHAVAVAGAGGCPILVDIDTAALDDAVAVVGGRCGGIDVAAERCDITDRAALAALRAELEQRVGPVDAVINNAAVNPTMNGPGDSGGNRFEDFPLERWNAELAVGLTGAMLVAQVFGAAMAERGAGVLVNIASDLGVIAPDHRIYAPGRRMTEVESFKPVSYSVCKTALIGLTRYLATYWAHRGVRCNALAPGGVEAGQDESLVEAIVERVPLGRMARADDYHGAIVFLCSDASAYMNGQVLVMDGGRSVW